tara:strand:- start:182 stop:625 length:444 start_codon:yes stop_codon:yes gene_type:complete
MDLDQLNRRYALGLAKLELAQYKGELRDPPTKELQQLREYFTSTTNRRAFGIKCVICGIVHEDCTPSSISKELGISQNSIDTMIHECEDAKWIEVQRDINNYRRVRGSKLLVDEWIDYSKGVSDFSAKIDFMGIQAARKYHQKVGLP